MINIWSYEYRDKIKIICDDDTVFEGIVSDITAAEERSDLGRQEDGICIISEDGKYIEIYQSEIKSIERLTSTENIA